jgi:glycosyltransferase involved in cell wall biosynthesis
MPSTLHILPSAIARGGQAIVGELARALDGRPDRHLVLTIFREGEGPPSIPVDIALDVSPGRRRFGIDPVALLAVRAAIRDVRPAVIVAHGGEPLKYAVLSGQAGGSRTPVLYYKIGVLPHAVGRPGHLQLYRFLTRRAALTLAISHEAEDEARDLLRVHPDRIRLLPNGRDPEPWLRVAPTTEGRPATAGFVGHLTATKRPELFVETIDRVRRRGHEIGAFLAGDGPLQAEVEAAAARVGDVDVLGRRDDIPEVLAGAGLFVFTSVPEGEGMPGVLIEAGMAGLPTVATRVPGATTVIDDGVTGFVVDADDAVGLADAVARLAVDDGLRAKMGQAARERCVEGFTTAEMAARLQRAIDEVAPA